MKLTELLESRDRKKSLSHMRNLVAIAAADGSLDDDEIDLITNLCTKVGLTNEDIKRIFERPDSIPFIIPDSYNERLEQFYDLVLVMMINGDIHEKEFALCEVFASKLDLGYNFQTVNQIVDDLRNAIENGIASYSALFRREYFFEPYSANNHSSTLVIKEKYISRLKLRLKTKLRSLLNDTLNDVQNHPEMMHGLMIMNAARAFCKNVKINYIQFQRDFSAKGNDIGLTKREYDHLVDEIAKEILKEFIELPDDCFIDEVDPETYLL